jgi:phosphonoacetate hydrolase
MHRRYFLFGTLGAAVASRRARAAARRKILIALLDGFGPEYLDRSEMPVLKRIAKTGAWKSGEGMIPSVTNVNNASLVTGTFPDEHGITTNYYYDPRTGQAAEMKSPEFLLRETLLEKASRLGWKTALVSSKDKVRTLCSRGAGIAASAEKPESRFLEMAGKQESMYSAEVNYWSFRVARRLLKQEAVDLLYLSTTDYMMHTHPPEAAASLEHLHVLDRMLGEILDDHPGIELYLSADHGMNAKTNAVDPVRLLRAADVEAAAAPLISDNHKIHHQDLGGSYYLYLKRPSDTRRAMEVLRQAPEVEEAFDRETAARKFRLLKSRIGDLFVLASATAVFGELPELRKQVQVRTHGSRHEARVPLIAYGRKLDWSRYRYNLDLTRYLNLERA